MMENLKVEWNTEYTQMWVGGESAGLMGTNTRHNLSECDDEKLVERFDF